MTTPARQKALDRLLAAIEHYEALPGLQTKTLSDSVARRFGVRPQDLWYALKMKAELLRPGA